MPPLKFILFYYKSFSKIVEFYDFAAKHERNDPI